MSDILIFQTMFRYLSPLISEWYILFPYLWSKYYKLNEASYYMTYLEIALRSEFSCIDLLGLLIE